MSANLRPFGDEYDMLSRAFEAADMAWWFMELPSGAINTSDHKSKMLGFSDPSAFVHYTSYTDLLHPDDYEKAMQAMRDHLEGKAPFYEVQYRIKTAAGVYVTFYDKGRIVSQKDGDTIIAGIVIKVNDTPLSN
jgi:PAS domain S-box-containing protein